ncbi:uncharacterized protein F5147DRAFT_784051 [Suillus discolor]|uniref:Chromo domain-containing protein n=1 Tax=Suillus discolor TaxID=1912936 RepID=A0A9P7EQV3_9AGAM|nr:uncharacterized protein F5147DRAFT_784051 [Suillus discolor]KAG2080850.1 hypothetical protein F5147DRAFT_784051 [Suillus discolor]
MDNQVAEFETQEKEWAVDRILSHKGNRSDTEFEVKWKAGDVTWLPYDQVDHLGALQDYFDVLGIETIADLVGGNEAPSVEHYHVFFGAMDLWEDYIKTPARQDFSPSTSSRQSPYSMSNTPNTNSAPAPLLRPLGNGRFVLPDRYSPNVTLLLTLDQIRMYLQHDADLRGGATPSSIPTPIGYDKFAIALNTNAGNGIQVAFVPEGEAGVHITGRPPALAELVGLEATRRTLPAPHDPREDAGRKWLDPCWTELMDEALWDNLECIKKQRQWREKGVSERQAKRQRREVEEAMKPFAPSKAVTNAVAGPSNTSPPAPALPPPELPPTPEDHDEEMSESNETTAEARAAKAKGRIPKK